jgi:hypothetical protein
VSSIQLTASRHILPFAAFLAGEGEPVGRLLRQAGLPATCLDDPKNLVPTAALWRFRELAAARVGSPSLTLTVMKPLDLFELGDVGRALLPAPTLLRMSDFR